MSNLKTSIVYEILHIFLDHEKDRDFPHKGINLPAKKTGQL